MSKKNIKVEGFIWIAENGAMEYGFFINDSDESVQFSTTLKQVVRDTLEMYKICGTDVIHSDHIVDVERLVMALKSAANIAEHELKRVKVEEND